MDMGFFFRVVLEKIVIYSSKRRSVSALAPFLCNFGRHWKGNKKKGWVVSSCTKASSLCQKPSLTEPTAVCQWAEWSADIPNPLHTRTVALLSVYFLFSFTLSDLSPHPVCLQPSVPSLLCLLCLCVVWKHCKSQLTHGATQHDCAGLISSIRSHVRVN